MDAIKQAAMTGAQALLVSAGGGMSTDTPKTDGACFDSFEHPLTQQNCEVVKSDFARQLERELAAEQEKAKRLREALELLSAIAESFYVATFTNAKSRDENKAKKFAMVNEIRAILEIIK